MRKRRAERRPLSPDPKFNDILVSRFINSIMLHGKKTTAQNILYSAMDEIEKRTGQNGYEVFRKALFNAQPVIEVRARRVGGATYQVPSEVRPERRTALSIRWLLNSARSRGDKTMARKLATELIAASNNEGGAIKKKDDVHRMAESNKAFAHFKW
ncbi:MAG: 30S ribosomal protein S7 [Ignavibacteria bacterium]|nr:MAG: 30S ribosomal protein S7 [Ignavibacteria bacterium]